MAKKVSDTTYRNRRTVAFDNGVQFGGSPKGIEIILGIINRTEEAIGTRHKGGKAVRQSVSKPRRKAVDLPKVSGRKRRVGDR